MLGAGFHPFNPQQFLLDLGFESTARELPFESGYCCQANGIHGAFVKIMRDDRCPAGVFDLSCAFDYSSDAACSRAVFESIERYALGAYGHSPTVSLRRDDPRLYKIPLRFSRFDYPEIVEAVPLFQLLNEKISKVEILAATGDIFAPVRTNPPVGRRIPMTNGAAIHVDPIVAARRAQKELIERDTVMRFWHSIEGRRVSYLVRERTQACEFLESFGLEVVTFCILDADAGHVVICFAMSKDGSYPRHICSAAADSKFFDAVQSAHLELIQTFFALAMNDELASRWYSGERKITTLDHHMYAHAISDVGTSANAAIRVLRDEKGREIERQGGRDRSAVIAREFYFADITPQCLAADFSAVRAISQDCMDPIVGPYIGDVFHRDEMLTPLHPFP